MHRPTHPTLLVLALLPWTALAPVAAATVYRWVDDQGKTHYAETVPPQYQNTARPLAPAAAKPTEDQQRQAQERAARQKRQAAEIESAASKPAQAALPAMPASTPVVKRPAQVPTATTDCQTWARLYQESMDCFGPFRTVRGATREEAFSHCTPVDEPPSRCLERQRN
jgi:hypothetical protein